MFDFWDIQLTWCPLAMRPHCSSFWQWAGIQAICWSTSVLKQIRSGLDVSGLITGQYVGTDYKFILLDTTSPVKFLSYSNMPTVANDLFRKQHIFYLFFIQSSLNLFKLYKYTTINLIYIAYCTHIFLSQSDTFFIFFKLTTLWKIKCTIYDLSWITNVYYYCYYYYSHNTAGLYSSSNRVGRTIRSDSPDRSAWHRKRMTLMTIVVAGWSLEEAGTWLRRPIPTDASTDRTASTSGRNGRPHPH